MSAKVLLIDDECEILDLLTEILEDEGYEVFQAGDGVEGLKEFYDKKPDLIISDMRMPRMDGLQVLKEVKKVKPELDVIILTGHSDEKSAVGCLHLGAYDYLYKPIEEIDVLLKTVERALYKKTLEEKNKQFVKKLQDMATRDPMTGLQNFRQLHTYLDNLIIHSNRYGHFFSLFMIDIDHFKNVNDTYGHLFGDHVLKELSKIMSECVRLSDQVFRYGGEEFIIILPETDFDGSFNTLNRIMESVRKYTFISENIKTEITISIGCSIFPNHSKDKTELIDIADKALYDAKETGRDKFIVSDKVKL